MKQNLRLLLLTLLCAVYTGVWGEEITYTFTSKSWEADVENWTSGKAGNAWADGQGIQVTTGSTGANATSPQSFDNISKIVVTYNTNKAAGAGSIDIQVGTNEKISKQVAYTGTDDGRYANFTSEFSVGNQSGKVKITVNTTTNSIWVKDITITYGNSISVSAPTFTPNGGIFTENQEVTISAETGADIYYTKDDTNPTTASTKYSAPFTVSETTTVKAIAVKEGVSSKVASATFSKVTPITVAAARQQNEGVVCTQGIVTSCVGTTAYIQDNNAGICVYGKALTVGDEIIVQGKLTTYNGLLEITGNPNLTYITLSSGNTVNAVVKTIAEINSDYSSTNALQGMLVKIEEAKVTAIDGQNTTIKQGESTIVVRGISSDVTYAVNDVLTLTGNVGCFNAAQIVNPTDVSVEKDETPTITLGSTTISVEQDGGTQTLTVTYNNFTPENEDVDVIFYESDGVTDAEYDWIEATIDDGIVLTIDANEGAERTAYFKVYALYGDANEVYSELVTVTQAAYVAPVADFATLPFEFNGGLADIKGTDGLTQEGLGGYDSAPKLKFDDTDDWLLLKFNERPGVLTFDIKGNSFSGSTFKVQTSEDGENFTDLKAYTTLTTTVLSEEFKNLGEKVRYIKWIYTNKDKGNVALGNIVLTKYVEPEKHTVTISSINNATITAYDEEDEKINSGDEVLSGTTVKLTIEVTEGYELDAFRVTDEEGEVALTENADGSWTFTMPASDVMVTCTVTKEAVDDVFVKVTSTSGLTSGKYLIVYEKGKLAFDGSRETLDAEGNTIAVVIKNNKIARTDANEASTFTIDATEGTIKSASGKYIGRTATSNGFNSSDTEAYTHTLSIDGNGNALIVSSGGPSLKYNKNSDQRRFRYFGSGQEDIQLYKLIEPEEITISDVGYATLFYSNKNLVVPTSVEAYTYKLNDTGDDVVISNTLKEKDVIPAGCGVVLKAIGGTYEFVESVRAVDAIQDNLLLGLDEEGQTVGPNDVDYYFYMLSTNKKGENVGFYWGNSTGSAFTTGAHKAYLAIPKESGINVSSFSFDDLNSIRGIQAENSVESGTVYTLSGMRVNSSQLPKGIYIVNGKKVVIK